MSIDTEGLNLIQTIFMAILSFFIAKKSKKGDN